MLKTVIIPGSFDPVTKGHLDLFRRAALIFDKVIVAIGNNPDKTYTFNINTQKDLIRGAIRVLGSEIYNKIEVLSFTGLLADFAYENNVNAVIKGVRNNQDFDYERLLHDVSLTQQAGIDTHILISNNKLSHISSTAAKSLVKHQGLLDEYVTLNVKAKLEFKLNKQFIVGLTGSIGVGKSFIGKQLRIGKPTGYGHIFPYKIYNIDVDEIVNEMYLNNSPVYIQLRETIKNTFNLKEFNKKELGDIVFNDSEALNKLNILTRNAALTLIRKKLNGLEGVIVLNSALLVESELLSLCNNNVILVNTSKENQLLHLKERGLSDIQIDRRINSQLDFESKLKRIEKAIDKDAYGDYLIVNNLTDNIDENVKSILYKIRKWYENVEYI